MIPTPYLLIQCPFCGSHRASRVADNEELDVNMGEVPCFYTVLCDGGAGGCGASCGFHDKEIEAVEAWNRRADD